MTLVTLMVIVATAGPIHLVADAPGPVLWSIDGVVVGETSGEALDVPIAPGAHRVEARAEGGDWRIVARPSVEAGGPTWVPGWTAQADAAQDRALPAWPLALAAAAGLVMLLRRSKSP